MEIEWESDGIELPDSVERALQDDSLVLFCGAGISAAWPSSLPGFRGLAASIADELGRSDLFPADPEAVVQFDVVMGELNELQGDVHARVASRLRSVIEPNSYHSDFLQIMSGPRSAPRIVTTNFDLLFEAAAGRLELPLDVYVAPALPLGNDFRGLVHLHGHVDSQPGQRMVVTDRDFGQAYITEGWATQFLTRMFERYTVVFVGYSADDTVMRYLARALPADASRRYAFTELEHPEKLGSKWSRLGVTPIPYPSSANTRHESLQSFVHHWQERVSATAQDRFDSAAAIVDSGPANLKYSERRIRWLLADPEHARHFRSTAEPVAWMAVLDGLGILAPLFDSSAPDCDEVAAWALWVASSLSADHGEVLLSIVSQHQGHLSSSLWLNIWLHLYGNYENTTFHRRLLLVISADQPSKDRERLSSLLRGVATQDIEAAETLLHQLLTPRLGFRSRQSWLGGRDSMDTEMTLAWRNSSIRDAWPIMLPALSDPGHLLSVVLNLIRAVEATESLFDGDGRRDALSIRRGQVDGVEPYMSDDPYVLVVDIARDLLREFVRTQGPKQALDLLDSPSEMVRRLALDALAESRRVEADMLVGLIARRDLVYDLSTKPETFRLLRVMYRHASRAMQEELLAQVAGGTAPQRNAEVREYERYNVLVWLSADASSDDPVHAALHTLQLLHPRFGPREHPDLNSWIQSGSGADPDPDPDPEGIYRGKSLRHMVAYLAALPEIDDIYDNASVLREVQDRLDAEQGLELDLLDEFVNQSFWSPAVWTLTLKEAIRRQGTWSAGSILERVDHFRGDFSEIGRRLVYPITYPESGTEPSPGLALERCRLLLGLWRRAVAVPSDEPPTDPSQAHATARGSLAFAYVETVLRLAQKRDVVEIDGEGLAGLTELMGAQSANSSDPSSMMVARFAGYILEIAPDWFDAYMQSDLHEITESAQSLSLWAGIYSARFMSKKLRLRTRDATRVAWPLVARRLPSTVEAFIQIHAAHFVFDTLADEHTWADPFVAAAPVTTRARWIRSIVHHLDGNDSDFQRLLFAYWQHRLDGQPPLHGAEQRALLEWTTLRGIDVQRATSLFVAGPRVWNSDSEGGFDYFDVDDFPLNDNNAFLRLCNHLLMGRTTIPPFLNMLVDATKKASAEDAGLAREIWGRLLELGFGPARSYLDVV
ncbi:MULTISPECIES: SIR2 family protein [unclassified Cryobacterium]|uniref:SIR2 family protein n=1 Tax=unclassified Cryobacterium TaxID=2649013 RepID=UPI00106B4488|nr:MULTISPECIES: SIR2 family protein [unclassified Cryobacterium]TFB97665.1 hypothetical protein E3O39_07585 [Cryobacterium sp. MDB2-A-1]TFC07785.1 hypothetical protein E3O35_18215 [Cryobacterium sp. MDB2-A-2]